MISRFVKALFMLVRLALYVALPTLLLWFALGGIAPLWAAIFTFAFGAVLAARTMFDFDPVDIPEDLVDRLMG